MQPIPKYDDALTLAGVTKNSLDILVILTYITCALYLVQLAMAFYNIWAFIIKQKRYKTPPLLVFYMLVVMLTCTRIWYSYFCLSYFIQADIVAGEIMPILKVNIGLI